MISKTSLGLIVLWVCICNGIQDSFLLLHAIFKKKKNIYIYIYYFLPFLLHIPTVQSKYFDVLISGAALVAEQ